METNHFKMRLHVSLHFISFRYFETKILAKIIDKNNTIQCTAKKEIRIEETRYGHEANE